MSVDKYLITFQQVVWLYITALSLVLHSSDYYRLFQLAHSGPACQRIFAELSGELALSPTLVCSLFSCCSVLSGKTLSPLFLVSWWQLPCSNSMLSSIGSDFELNQNPVAKGTTNGSKWNPFKMQGPSMIIRD